MRAPTATLAHLREQARSMTAKDAVKDVVDHFQRNDLLTSASAIAFQVLWAIVPFVLFVVALLGALRLEDLYMSEVAPAIADSVSTAGYVVIDTTVDRVFGEKQFWWITIGALFTVWEMSGATRTVMGAFDRIYECEHRRGTRARFLVSIWLSIATGGLLLLAVAAFVGGPLAGTAGTILRWPVAAALLFATLALFVRFAPSDRQPLDWASFGATLVVVAWLGTSLAFAFYVRNVADYGSIFGALSTVIIVLGYLYLSAAAFLTGAQVDALVRKRLHERQERGEEADTRLVPAT